MHAKIASILLLSLGAADVAALDLWIAPRLVSRDAAPAAPAVPRDAIIVQPAPADDGTERGAIWAAQVRVDPPRRAALPTHAAPDIPFASDSTLIDRVGPMRDLARVARELASDPDRRLLIRGHADPAGLPEYNLALGQRRADKVAQFLVQHGAPADRIDVEAVGAAEPVDARPYRSAWARDRRVELLWR